MYFYSIDSWFLSAEFKFFLDQVKPKLVICESSTVRMISKALSAIDPIRVRIGCFEPDINHDVTFHLSQLFANYDTHPVTRV